MNGTNGAAKPPWHASQETASPPSDVFSLLIGTFKSPELYTLHFKPPSSHTSTVGTLTVAHVTPAAGGHSWLALNRSHTNLYTTVWATPPTIAAYALQPTTAEPKLLSTASVASLSGYVAVTPLGRYLLSVGGPSGDVFALHPADKGGGIGAHVQTLSFRRTPADHDDGRRDGVAHGAFGGLRWGAHSVDVSPDGSRVYIADIGHNCIWVYALDETVAPGCEPLVLRAKVASPRPHDGPRHCWPHPGGRVVYCVQEHSGMVDAFMLGPDDAEADEDGVGSSNSSNSSSSLVHLHGHTLLPSGKSCEAYWADEVRTSRMYHHRPGSDSSSSSSSNTPSPRWLYASTRGLDVHTKGYVAAYELDEAGGIRGPAVAIYETRTSGGLANAVEPAPRTVYEAAGLPMDDDDDYSAEEEPLVEEFLALTDSEQGWVVVLGWNGRRFREVAAVRLEGAQAATAVWV